MAGTLEEIDTWLRHIWLKVVKKEYDRSRILEESNLHSTVYFHLRKLIESSKSKKKKPFIYSEGKWRDTSRILTSSAALHPTLQRKLFPIEYR